ncbi:phenylalanine--tRNA ligase subunit beta [Spirilliplanes yamanashiensis]|uniref:Phenylalanine--tRNA ligase beta subunit n=1 Tax=Spirilliplanes yamanashiensis TaxID=42233 RepID=A0A8J3YBV2_9ACTN|nr:phenylalanine--tRNA ligase subunit beta [Spirilliplanes yamanashiensis]MDP9818576.1 phenylalanyl-tRNA synthetase beta chain [Spirilliplanes yamanashiensis]GIJ05032.1 phenylalanine--tRNA ligase beta subunit [Spirilliplanes yamanashiensis]
MRLPLSWLKEYVDIPAGADVEQALIGLGIEVDDVVDQGATVTGDLVVGRVLTIEELTGFKKPIRFCTVDVGNPEPQEIVCGARNFAEGDLVVVILPGGVLPGGFAIGARKTYGRNSHGMICSARELGLGDDHDGIIVLRSGTPGEDARPVVGLDDVLFELEITPDRGYALSVRGIARELSHAFGTPFRDPALGAATAATPEPAYDVRIEDTVGCDRFAARAVRGVDPSAATPAFIAQRLTTAGIRTINLPVDITNYLMLELGQPMHAFDLGLLTGPLVVRRARAGEKLTTLDGVARVLDAEDMVICDDSGPISLAAVMGGETSEVQPTTVDVLFEAAHWDPVMVGRTARRHRLFSEAAKRWERGVDPQLPLVALERAVALLVEHGGGTPDGRVLDVDNVRPLPPVSLDSALPARRIGVPYTRERVVQLLGTIGCAVTGGDVLTVQPPSWRPDLTDPADLVEEVARIDGYDNIPSELPPALAGRGLTAGQRRRRSVGRALAEQGYVEITSYPFVPADADDAFGLPADDPRRSAVRLTNPLSEEEPRLRTSLLPPMLATLRRNLGRGHRDLALYELGLVFEPRLVAAAAPAMGVAHRPSDADWAAADATVPRQPWHAAVVLTGDVAPAGWWGAGRPASWSDAVEAARTVVAAAGVADDRVRVRAAERAPWHPGRCAEILVGDVVVGHAGELHPSVLATLELPRRTCAAELDLDAIGPADLPTGPAVSGFPPALIDVALVLDATVPAAEVQEVLAAGAGPLLESVRLFDVYASDALGAGKRSLAYKLTFRAPDRTLAGEEAVAARDAAVAAAAARFGAVLRGA